MLAPLAYAYPLIQCPNQFDALDADAFLDTTKLVTIKLQDNSLPAIPPRVFQALRSLKIIDLSRNSIAEVADSSFAGPIALESIGFEGNALSCEFDSNSRTLDFDGCKCHTASIGYSFGSVIQRRVPYTVCAKPGWKPQGATDEPTQEPTKEPSKAPTTPEPTSRPTQNPTTPEPTSESTSRPTQNPTTSEPTGNPTKNPTLALSSPSAPTSPKIVVGDSGPGTDEDAADNEGSQGNDGGGGLGAAAVIGIVFGILSLLLAVAFGIYRVRKQNVTEERLDKKLSIREGQMQAQLDAKLDASAPYALPPHYTREQIENEILGPGSPAGLFKVRQKASETWVLSVVEREGADPATHKVNHVVIKQNSVGHLEIKGQRIGDLLPITSIHGAVQHMQRNVDPNVRITLIDYDSDELNQYNSIYAQ